jgi:hypothetical protein
VAYPKRATGVASDLDFTTVQRFGLDAGMVDTKSVAADDVWTAVRLVTRREDRR